MDNRSAKLRVALVGTGYIASIHLDALKRCPGVEVVALCDPVLERVRDLGRRYGIERVHGSVAELLEVGAVDAAHVLVPPGAHAEVATQLLRGGLSVLVEKPMAMTRGEVEDLRAAAERSDVVLSVNHNQLFHPCVRRLEGDLARGRLGRLEQVHVVHSVPLRQLQSGDVSHFMFQSEANILLEQAVHPLSVVQRLLGRCLDLTATVEAPLRLPTGAPFRDTWTLSMRCRRGRAVVFLAFGRPLHETTLTAVGTDGSARIDLQRSTYALTCKTRWLEFWDTAANSVVNGLRLIGQGFGSVADYGLGLFGLRAYSDSYLRSMGDSIAAFHAAVRAKSDAPCGPDDAAQVIEMCELAASAAEVSWQAHPRFAVPAEQMEPRNGEVVVTGGTGFLGRHLVPALLEAGHPVTLLVRKPEFLPERLRDAGIRVLVGDVRDPEAAARAATGASAVIHMATCPPGPGETAEESMAAGARTIGQACLDAGVQRMVFTSSTAALYLGDDRTVRGAEGPDPQPASRAEYSRGKIAAEQALKGLERADGLGLVVLRPAIVVGEGGMLDHSGVGLWVRDNHCVGWGIGSHPLPLVLARDCADAIVKSLTAADAVGRSYNLAGDVRWSAADYVRRLRRRTGRDYRFHRMPIVLIVLVEWLKWLVKLAARRPRELPSWRDFRSRAFRSKLDCSDAKADLGWQPEADGERFEAEAIPEAGTEPREPTAKPKLAVDAS